MQASWFLNALMIIAGAWVHFNTTQQMRKPGLRPSQGPAGGTNPRLVPQRDDCDSDDDCDADDEGDDGDDGDDDDDDGKRAVKLMVTMVELKTGTCANAPACLLCQLPSWAPRQVCGHV